MNKERIKELVGNPDFIPGIYNYCDRWCERCKFTARCMNYALCEEPISKTDTLQVSNVLFWKKLEETFKLAFDLLKQTVLKSDDDSDHAEINHFFQRNSGQVTDQKQPVTSKSNPVFIADAREYIMIVDLWFKSAINIFKEKEEELKLRLNLNILVRDPKEEALQLEEAVKTIHWYQHQIYIKLMRAIQGRIYIKQTTTKQTQNDSNGSAKVALISIDRSIAAWKTLREYLTDHDDKIFDLLVYLDRMRRDIEQFFPEARAFIRPGFDE